ncbi:AAA family ATPase [Promicromonospora sp. NPDC057488]|uniref:AAA family ATPase n=1 Tax=Promicromonospora sp. NPDC057488 TaxID=3346147 RepID=UPI0036736308
MSYAHLTELRLTAFKSFHDQVLPIDPTTILIGRNGSGKSNALDALDVLARLANAQDIKDALDPVRGGAASCAPHGTDAFRLGCTVASHAGHFEYDIEVRVRPQIEILYEQISRRNPDGGGNVDLFWSDVSDGVETYGLPDTPRERPVGSPRRTSFIASMKFAGPPSRAGLLHDIENPDVSELVAAGCLVEALRSVFHLEPIPAGMRDYVAETDHELRRDAANVSAALARLSVEHPAQVDRLRGLIGAVSDLDVAHLGFTRTDLGDVMLLVAELVGAATDTTPARELSDGLLRLAAVGTALLSERDELDLPATIVTEPSTTLVMEEIDNGLHPAQAKRVLDLVREATAEQGSRIILTTHNPALLDAATGEMNRSVIVCYRDKESGRSVLSRVTDLPGYARAMTVGGIGDAVTQGRLAGPEERSADDSVLRGILGIDA